MIFPDEVLLSDNSWGVPTLINGMFPRVLSLPFLPWACQGRERLMPGTWHFYVDDSKFSKLWSVPDQVALSTPVSVVEPNFTIPSDAPRAVALYQVFRKRFLARYWQQVFNLNIIVDLNVCEQFEDVNLLGVPKGWGAYCTRGNYDLGRLVHQYAIARNHSDSESPLFIVYAGGKDVELLCMQYGWYYFPTYRGPDSYRGVVNGGR